MQIQQELMESEFKIPTNAQQLKLTCDKYTREKIPFKSVRPNTFEFLVAIDGERAPVSSLVSTPHNEGVELGCQRETLGWAFIFIIFLCACMRGDP